MSIRIDCGRLPVSSTVKDMSFERPRFPWKLADGELPLGGRTLLMGVIDLSPESHPERPDPDRILDRAIALEEQGADLLDVTAVPLAPSGRRIESHEERARLVPSLRKVIARLEAPVVVTTYNSATAERVLELGAAVIRDPTGLSLDRGMGAVVNAVNAGLILGHATGPPQTWKGSRSVAGLMELMQADMTSAIARARRASIEKKRIVLDPGFGIGKHGAQNYEMLEHFRAFHKLMRPVMVSPSRLPFLTDTIRSSEDAFETAAAAFAAFAVRQGAHMVRTDTIEKTAAAIRIGESLLDLSIPR